MFSLILIFIVVYFSHYPFINPRSIARGEICTHNLAEFHLECVIELQAITINYIRYDRREWRWRSNMTKQQYLLISISTKMNSTTIKFNIVMCVKRKIGSQPLFGYHLSPQNVTMWHLWNDPTVPWVNISIMYFKWYIYVLISCSLLNSILVIVTFIKYIILNKNK